MRRLLLALLLVLAAAPARGQEPVAGTLDAVAATPEPRVAARDLARVLGAEHVADGDVLVLRAGGRALTLFAGESEGLLSGDAATPTTLSAPAERDGDAWTLPLDAGSPLGLVRVGEDRLLAPDGRAWRLAVREPPVAALSPRAEATRPAPGARAVRLFAPGPGGRVDGLSLWAADLAAASLVAPEARAALDAALRESGGRPALLFVITSLAPGARAEAPTVWEEGRLRVAAGERLEVLAGDLAALAPDRPWLAVAWLPAGTRLDRPLRVAWHGAEAEVSFRDRSAPGGE